MPPPRASSHTFYVPADRAVANDCNRQDIGNQVAALLTGEWSGKRIIELGTPLNADDVASAMGQALGKPVTAQAVPREQWAATFESFGFPPGSTGAYEEMLDGVNSGWIDFGVAGTEPVAATTTAAQVFAKARQA